MTGKKLCLVLACCLILAAFGQVWTVGSFSSVRLGSDTGPRLLPCTSDPSVSGLAAPVGSKALCSDGTEYLKTGVTDTEWTASVGGGSGFEAGFFGFGFTAPDNESFSWVNQGSAAVSTANGGVYMTAPTNGNANSYRIRTITAPVTPYTCVAGFVPNFVADQSANNGYFAIGFRQSSDGKLVSLAVQTESRYRILKFNSATAWSADYVGTTLYGWDSPGPIWMRIGDDGSTNRTMDISFDGITYVNIHTVGRTDFLTADEVWWGMDPTNRAQQMWLLSWVCE